MIIYNVTTKVTQSIAQEWLQWIGQEHIPAMIATGCFTSATVMELLEIDDMEGPTYAIQYLAESKAQYNRYIELYAPELRQQSFDKWGDQFIAFRTLMRIVQ